MSFSFSEKNLAEAQKHIKKYPVQHKQSAVLPLLDLAQKQNGGWLSQACLEYVGSFLDIPAIKVHEIASFYSMFNLKPVGKFHIQVCGTTPCMLCGAQEIQKSLENALLIKTGETTPDGLFTLSEVECLGACVNGPVIQINDDFLEDLSPTDIPALIEEMKSNQFKGARSFKNRQCSMPLGGVKDHA